MSRNRAFILVGALGVVVVAFAVAVYFQVGHGPGQARTIDVNVSGSKMTPATITVHQNDRVTMTVTTDKAEEIHLHGYDIPFEVKSAGGSATHSFTADKTGSFEIEIEDTSTGLGFLNVTP
jgi:FtsP/CotA-like multicopper oxidase with cupredoxin domain